MDGLHRIFYALPVICDAIAVWRRGRRPGLTSGRSVAFNLLPPVDLQDLVSWADLNAASCGDFGK